jgi:hypothetical protein
MFKKIQVLLSSFGNLIIATIEKVYNQFKKNATGGTIKTLRQATDFKVSEAFELDIFGSKVFEYNEEGRPAGAKMPPQGVLIDWMQARGIDLGAEWAIRKSIAEKGIKPVPIIETSFFEIVEDFEQKAAPTIFRAISDGIIEMIKKGFDFGQGSTK